MHTINYHKTMPDTDLHRTDGRSIVQQSLLGIASVILWSISLKYSNTATMGDYGLLSVLSPLYFSAIGLLTISFTISLSSQRMRTIILALHIVALIFMIHGTPALLYDAPRYPWSYKHIGVVSFIQENNGIRFNSNPYFNWPGFFALFALINEIAGLNSALIYAAWAQVFFNLLFFSALLMIFKALTNDQRLIWTALWLYFLTNWVGQDYFAPQALNYFLYLVIIAVFLTWFHSRESTVFERIQRVLPGGSTRIRHWFSVADARISSQKPLYPHQEVGIKILIVLVAAFVTASHQLTPFILIGGVITLAIFRRLRGHVFPLLLGVLAISWLFFSAEAFVDSNVAKLFGSFGQVSNNLTRSVYNLSGWQASVVHVALASRSLTTVICLIGIVGALRRLHHGIFDFSAMLLGGIPFVMIAFQSYGGEILYRTFLFALPFVTFFAAAAFYPIPRVAKLHKPSLAVAAVSLVILPVFLLAYYGNELRYNISLGEVQAVQQLSRIAKPGSLILIGSANFAREVEGFDQYHYFPLTRTREFFRGRVDEQTIDTMANRLLDSKYPDVYLLITRAQKHFVRMYIPSLGTYLDDLEQAMREDERFIVVFSNADAVIFSIRRT